MTGLLIAAVVAIAWANGANDNFKGVATLYGSRVAGYGRALLWATVTTVAGVIAAAFLTGGLVRAFGGHGLVSADTLAAPGFGASVALGAAATVWLATRLGLPVSTTHALLGGLIGAGLARGGEVAFGRLAAVFLLPLLVSPFAAAAVTAPLIRILSAVRRRLGIVRESCACVGAEAAPTFVPLRRLAAGDAAALRAGRTVTLSLGRARECLERYDGQVFGVRAGTALDLGHAVSAGAVSFARGLNDAPKLAALLLLAPAAGSGFAGFALVAAAMAAGGWLAARPVAETMSRRVTAMNHGEGFTASAVTAGFVLAASAWSLPVSTTHVSCGAIFGLGAASGRARWDVIRTIGGAWIVTFPLAALFAAVAATVLR